VAGFKDFVGIPGVQRIAHDVDRSGNQWDNAKRKANHLCHCQQWHRLICIRHVQQSPLQALQRRRLQALLGADERASQIFPEEQHPAGYTIAYMPPTGHYRQLVLRGFSLTSLPDLKYSPQTDQGLWRLQSG
jgi:hypothetical protein